MTGHEQRIHRVMDHVRQNLDGDLSLEALAKVAHFSPYHFHRVFRASAGETLTAFTQRARLERAAYLMKASPERPLGSIALEVGFCQQSDFSRVFRRRYGVAPSAWDRVSRLDDRGLVGVEQAKARARAEGPELVARIVEHPAVRLAYVRLRTPFVGDVLRQGYTRLTRWLERRDIDWRGCSLLGLSWDHYETTPIDQVRFDFGFAVPRRVAAQDGIGVIELPAARAVDVRCQGDLSRVALAWDFLYDTWLPRSSYEPDDMPAIKRFRRRPDELGWRRWDLDCSIAIRRRLG